jgi:hypothetical protein
VNDNDHEYRLSHDENGRHYEEGEMVFPNGYSPYVYSSSPGHLKRCNEKHDITEKEIEEMKAKWYSITDEDIEQIKARWWCYDSKDAAAKATRRNNIIET